MGKIRHIAIRCEDTEATSSWLQAALELRFVQRRDSGAIDLSDGDINVTLLPLGLGAGDRPVAAGFEHIGVTVDDEDAARQRMLANGAVELNPIGLGDVYYEAKFKSPVGLVVDVGRWAGTSAVGQAAAEQREEPVYAGE
ncbi:MAG TPA: VOC family protein [Chloroflexota bacterium]|jgi:catechol 2,3-dioxygenase-like lactoylglutathione lyase family enzyme|nr:VOC family protein [Chloroflexota bacterium]